MLTEEYSEKLKKYFHNLDNPLVDFNAERRVNFSDRMQFIAQSERGWGESLLPTTSNWIKIKCK